MKVSILLFTLFTVGISVTNSIKAQSILTKDSIALVD